MTYPKQHEFEWTVLYISTEFYVRFEKEEEAKKGMLRAKSPTRIIPPLRK